MDSLKKVHARFFATDTGEEPVRTWLKRLSREDRRTIGIDIQKVEYGWPLGMPVCRSLGHGLWEVRSQLSGGRIARVIFAFFENEMILLHAFIKKTAKTPEQDKTLALRRFKSLNSPHN